MNKWIRRKRNSWGYGVQSPSDFYFVQHVLRERLPYYSYESLKELESHYETLLPSYSSATNQLLFRLANHIHPKQIIEIGAGLSIFATAMGHPFANHTAITSDDTCYRAMQPLLDSYPQVSLKKGDEMALFQQYLSERQAIDMLHIAHTAHYCEIVDAALPYTDSHTIIIIEELRASRKKQEWWKGLQESPKIGITYDLGSIGLLFFDYSRSKNTYWINLRKRI